MNCRKCGAKAKRRRAGEFYCSRHGDLPQPKGQMAEFIGPHQDIEVSRPVRANPQPTQSIGQHT